MVCLWLCCDVLAQILSIRSTSVCQVIDHYLSKNETINSLWCSTGVCSWTASFDSLHWAKNFLDWGDWVVSLLTSQYLTTSVLMTLGCIFPSQLITQNPLSATYSNALSLFRTGWLPTDLTSNPNKTELVLIGHERQRMKYLSMFPVLLLSNEICPWKTAKILVLCSMRISF